MSILVVGSVALDSVKTPRGEVNDAIGGSAVYFSLAASLFTDVHLVGVVGRDFPDEPRRMLESRGIDISGLQEVDGETFRWSGKFEGAMNEAETLSVDLNVFGDFRGEVPEDLRRTPYVFLANGSPVLQRNVLSQMPDRQLSVCDTMDLWIENTRDELDALLDEVDGLVINDDEVRQFTGESNLVNAGCGLLARGLQFAVVKKGEHGALLFSGEQIYPMPAYPTGRVVDPTGAGDSFAGGMMGCIAEAGTTDDATLRRAVACGTVVASFTVQDFSVGGLLAADREKVEARMADLAERLHL